MIILNDDLETEKVFAGHEYLKFISNKTGWFGIWILPNNK